MTAAAPRLEPTRELAGACGDLGTFLPLTIGAILVGGLPAASVLAGFGLAYLLAAAVYRAPVPVQPMKVAGAVLITTAPATDVVIGAGLALGLAFLLLGSSGLMKRLVEAVPATVIAGLQAGLGLGLGWSALALLAGLPFAGLAFVALTGGLLILRPRWPVAVIVLAVAALAAPWLGTPVPAGVAAAGLAPPSVPGLDAVAAGLVLIALPQFPLTLTNAVIVTASAGREYYPRASRLDVRHLALTTGTMNLLTAPFGAMPMCHGAGGLAAHYRFGARTALAPAVLGAALLGLGLFAAGPATRAMAAIPDAALGALLLIPAIDLVRIVRPMRFTPVDRTVLALLTAIAFFSPGIAFLAGLAAHPLAHRIAARSQKRPHAAKHEWKNHE